MKDGDIIIGSTTFQAGEPKEGSLFVCLRCEDIDPKCIKKGSKKLSCGDCGAMVWVSPEGVQWVKEKSLPIICLPCAMNRASMLQQNA